MNELSKNKKIICNLNDTNNISNIEDAIGTDLHGQSSSNIILSSICSIGFNGRGIFSFIDNI